MKESVVYEFVQFKNQGHESGWFKVITLKLIIFLVVFLI